MGILSSLTVALRPRCSAMPAISLDLSIGGAIRKPKIAYSKIKIPIIMATFFGRDNLV